VTTTYDSGTHTVREGDAWTVYNLGVGACDDYLGECADPRDAGPGDVVGYVQSTPHGDGQYGEATCDGQALTIDGVPCHVGTHDYDEDGLATALVYRDEDAAE